MMIVVATLMFIFMVNDHGTDKCLQLYVSSGGNGVMKAEEKLLLYSNDEEIKLCPSNDIVDVHDILKINPIAAAPDAQTNEGAIYYH